MASRRAGQRLRNQARARKREVLGKHWFALLRITVGYLLLGTVVAGFIALVADQRWVFFITGVWVGSLLVMMALALEVIDGQTARLTGAAEAEANTAREIQRLHRHGWRSVHNLHFERGDVDHVAIGPGGLVVIETKSSSAEWDWLCRQGVTSRWARQANDGAFRVRHLTKQHTRLDVNPTPIIAAWLPGQTDDPESVHGVMRVRGKNLADFVRSLPRSLDEPDIQTIHAALSRAGQQFDEYVGVQHPGWLRRLIE
jgi:hypothetical protein